MEDVSPFVSHFARLAWLLAHRPTDLDEQKETLRQASMQLSAHTQAVILRDITFAAAAHMNDSDENSVGVRELAMRMTAHSVRLLEFEIAVPVREVLEIARAIATDPATGDEGASFDVKIMDLYLTGITTHLGSSGFVRHATPGVLPSVSSSLRTPMSVDQIPAKPVPPTNVQRPASHVQEMMQVQLMRVAGRDETVSELIGRLDLAIESPNPNAIVDDVARATEDLANQGKWVDVVLVLDRAHQHLQTLHDGDVKRAFMMGMRRLQRPAMLSGVARLIPGHRDLRNECARLLVLAGETGADVLIDLLIGSEATSERRAYVDALRQCPVAVKSLLHLLSDDRWFVVRNAAALLGELGSTEADQRLAGLMSHREPRVRQAAAIALGKLGTSRSLLALLQGLNDTSPDVRLQAVLAIAAAKNPRAIPWIMEALDHEQDLDVQGAMIFALGAAPTEDGIARLVRLAEAGGMLVRKPVALRLRAIEALAEAGTPSARHALLSLQADRDREVRAAVEQAVGKMTA